MSCIGLLSLDRSPGRGFFQPTRNTKANSFIANYEVDEHPDRFEIVVDYDVVGNEENM
jgi:hypothetical protein